MTSKRTKLLFGLSSLPLVCVGVGAAWAVTYSLLESNISSTFVIFHIHWVRVFLVSFIVLMSALVSLFFDNQSGGKK